MAFSLEAIQAMMGEFHRMNTENMTALMTKQNEASAAIIGSKGGNLNMTDSRGIGRPITFQGDESKYAEWKAKLLAYLRVSNRSADAWLSWAASCTNTITEEDLDLNFPDEKAEMTKFAVNLYSVLMHCTEDDAFRICHSVKEGNGLEAMRLLMKRYESRTPGTKRALVKAIINNRPAKKPEELEKNLMHIEELIKKYEALGGAELPDDLKVTLIIDLCTKDLKEHLDLTTKDMAYKEVRDEIVNSAERKRNTFNNDLKAMDVDECVDEAMWWGGREPTTESWEHGDELYSMGWHKGYGKKGGFKDPKGGNGNYKGDSKGSYKGDSKGGYYKGDSKGDTYKGDGKGKGGFQGYGHWCWEWGHSQSRCRAKDEYMENIRSKGGKGGKGEQNRADNVEDAQKSTLENLEAKGGFRALCSLEHDNRCAPFRRAVVMTNRFAALQEDENDHEHFKSQASTTSSRIGRRWNPRTASGRISRRPSRVRQRRTRTRWSGRCSRTGICSTCAASSSTRWIGTGRVTSCGSQSTAAPPKT
jgi:hypothetical protein